jgi:hypothetical protein
MQYIYVNKNYLVPEIKTFPTLNSAITKLLNVCEQMNKKYCSNVYVLSDDKLYFSNGYDVYFVSDDQNITKVNFPVVKSNRLETMNKFFSGTKTDEFATFAEMEININIPNDNLIIVDKEINTQKNAQVLPKEKKEKTKEELEILALCEETFEIYNQELKKMKELEKKIKIIDDNQKSLLKKRSEKIFTNLSKLSNDYNTYKLIQKKITKKPDAQIPSLFVLKYQYFKNKVIDQDSLDLLEKIHTFNLDEILNKDEELDTQIVNFVNQYGLDSKNLNVKFDHSWEELEFDTSESNNSKLGT